MEEMTIPTIISFVTMVITYIFGIIAKKYEWMESKYIPYQNALIGILAGIINGLYKMDLIKNPNFNIKAEIPFMPFITLGYVGFLIFGDFIAIISTFIKLLF